MLSSLGSSPIEQSFMIFLPSFSTIGLKELCKWKKSIRYIEISTNSFGESYIVIFIWYILHSFFMNSLHFLSFSKFHKMANTQENGVHAIKNEV